MRKRDLLRLVPGVGRLVRRLDAHERHNRLLTAECWRLAAENHRLKAAPDGPPPRAIPPDAQLPLPPGVLRLLVAGTDDAGWFLTAGRRAVDSLASLLAKNGFSLYSCQRILDFGSGCGRVIRHLRDLTAELHGCDTNPVAVEWCAGHLPFGHFQVNGAEPPLPHPDATFDLVYAFSVFTHLPEPLQKPWMAELRRVLRPGGRLVLSLHGDAMLGTLTRAERTTYRAGTLVVRAGELAGTNHCAVFHPPAFVRDVLAAGFDVQDMVPEGATGNPPQDTWLLRKAG